MSAATTTLMSSPLERAEQAAAVKDWDRAAAFAADAGTSSYAMGKRAFYLSRAGRYDDALVLLGELRAREPSNFRWPYMAGFQHYQREQWQQALDCFRQALILRPDHLPTMWRAAYALHRSGQTAKSQLVASRLLRIWHALDDDAKRERRGLAGKASYLLGKAQLRSDPSGAAKLFEQACDIDPDDPDKLYRLGQSRRRAGQPSEALGPLRRAAKLKPAAVYIRLELACSLNAAGDDDEASRALSAIQRRCRGWDAYKAAGLAMRLGNPALAMQLADRALEHRNCRSEPGVRHLRAQARAACPRSVDDSSTGRARGRIDVVRRERRFGFIVDDADGTRRHFRLPRGCAFRRGDRVSFLPVDEEKGPAAKDVQASG